MKLFKGVVVSLACWGAVCPQAGLMAADAAQKPAAKAPAAPQVIDVALSTGGTFTGQVVDSQGRGLDGAAVVVRQADREVAKTVSNKEGYFSVTNLKGGTYQVAAGQSQGVYRFWAPNTAPPSAKAKVLMVSGKAATRGQIGGGGGTGLLIAGGLAILGTTIYTAVETNKNGDDIKEIQDTLNSPN